MRKYKDKIIIWPIYFDLSKPVSAGRRLPKKLAVEAPSLEEITEAATSLGLNPQSASDARFPRSWWQRSGYVIVDKRQSKRETLRTLASHVVELRRSRSASSRKV